MMGRGDSQGEDAVVTGFEDATDTSLFFTDSYGSHADTAYGIYLRSSNTILGEDALDDAHNLSQPRAGQACFNCGSLAHKLTACPEPKNHRLVDISRLLHERHSGGGNGFRRIHDVSSWKEQRLEWLDYFEPGVVKGELLRDALGNDHPGWLHNISRLGYPKGWLSAVNPKSRVRARIVDQCHDGDVDGDTSFTLFGDGVEEVVDIPTGQTEEHVEEASSSLVQRWAIYPTSHFLYDLLPVYQPPQHLPLPVPSFTNTVTDEWEIWKHELWESIILSSEQSAQPSTLAEMVYKFVYYTSYAAALPPPAPKSEPPPLPPLPPSPPPSPKPLSTVQLHRKVSTPVSSGAISDDDMDMSDSD